MAISSTEVCATIPLGTYYIVYNARNGVTPWISWADTHSHYSSVAQVAAFIWKSDPTTVTGLELYRWSLIFCSFIFFAFFGFADEARQHYRRVYTTLASHIGYSTFTLQGSSHAYVVLYPLFFSARPTGSSLSCSTSSVPFVKSSKGGITISVVTSGETTVNRRSSVSFADRHSTIPSISLTTDDYKNDLKIEEYSPSDSRSSASVESFIESAIMQDRLPDLPAGIIQPMFSPASFPRSHTHSGAEAV
jgi:pheromone a factor receptor